MNNVVPVQSMFDIAIVSEIGKRSHMEDTYWLNVNRKGSEIFCGIYDGHNGVAAAEYVRDNLHKIFFEALKTGKNELEAFSAAYQQTSKDLSAQKSGTTAVNFLVKNKIIFFANAGDARLVVMEKSSVKQLTYDHRLTDPRERQRVLNQGAFIEEPYVYKNDYGLMPTRTIGDEYFKDVGVIATPTTGAYRLAKEDKWILAGTDGLFDELENEEIRALIDSYTSANKAAEALKNEILINRAGTDNLTFVLLRIKD